MAKGIEKKLDELLSKFIRSANSCEVCGRTGLLNCHHFIGRRVRPLRWALENLICCCSSCHTMGKTSFHTDPQFAIKWMQENRPDDYNYCLEHKNDPPLKDWQKQELLEKYKEIF